MRSGVTQQLYAYDRVFIPSFMQSNEKMILKIAQFKCALVFEFDNIRTWHNFVFFDLILDNVGLFRRIQTTASDVKNIRSFEACD